MAKGLCQRDCAKGTVHIWQRDYGYGTGTMRSDCVCVRNFSAKGLWQRNYAYITKGLCIYGKGTMAMAQGLCAVTVCVCETSQDYGKGSGYD